MPCWEPRISNPCSALSAWAKICEKDSCVTSSDISWPEHSLSIVALASICHTRRWYPLLNCFNGDWLNWAAILIYLRDDIKMYRLATKIDMNFLEAKVESIGCKSRSICNCIASSFVDSCMLYALQESFYWQFTWDAMSIWDKNVALECVAESRMQVHRRMYRYDDLRKTNQLSCRSRWCRNIAEWECTLSTGSILRY